MRGDALSAARHPRRGRRHRARLALEQHRRLRRSAADDADLRAGAGRDASKALANLAAIAATDGVDGVFFGPADLSASMGHLGEAGHPDVQARIDDGIAAVLAAGKAPGILATNPERARSYLAAGALFVAVGVDTTILARGARALADDFGRRPPP